MAAPVEGDVAKAIYGGGDGGLLAVDIPGKEVEGLCRGMEIIDVDSPTGMGTRRLIPSVERRGEAARG